MPSHKQCGKICGEQSEMDFRKQCKAQRIERVKEVFEPQFSALAVIQEDERQGKERNEPYRAVRPKFCGRLDNALRALYNMRTDESDVVRYGVAPCGERRDETAFRSVPEKIR